MAVLARYSIGKDFTEDQVQGWLVQLEWWINTRMKNVDNSREHAEKVIMAAFNGTKLDGTPWPNISNDFYSRVKQLIGFDLKLGIGIREPTVRKIANKVVGGDKTDSLPPLDLEKAMEMRTDYIQELITKYPHLDTAVYKPKVEELAETIVKSRMLSNDFMTSRGKELETLSRIRESLHTQIGELMEFLEISPKQRVTKSLDVKNADVGSLVAKLEAHGEVWREYERLDALREALQFYRMLHNTRPDGTTPQLDAWEFWHMTRSKPIKFTCRHGETYELIAGFTPEEIEQALIQAHKVYGFGLEGIDTADKEVDISKIVEELPEATEEPDELIDDPDGE